MGAGNRDLTHPVLAFPAVAGMAYPTLDAQGLIHVVTGTADVAALPLRDRQAVRVLMTTRDGVRLT